MRKKKFITEKLLKTFPSKTIAGKKVYFKSHKNLPSMKLLEKVYKSIPDDKKVPVVFQTKKQYLKEYILNQEHIKKIDFPKWQEQQYINKELPKMKNITSRFTTYHNKYIEPRVVMFTDNKLTPQQVKENILHEYGHELYEKRKMAKPWKFKPQYSPTYYGKTDEQEDFAESYMIWKDNQSKQYNNNKNLQKRMRFFNKRIRKDKQSEDKTFVDLLPVHDAVKGRLPKIESQSYTQINFPQTGKIHYKPKPLYLLGKFKDLFQEGEHLQIKHPQTGEVLRDIKKEGDKIFLTPGTGPQLTINDTEDLYYEPWFMDRGSILFNAPLGIPGLRGKLKLGTEDDDLQPVIDNESEDKDIKDAEYITLYHGTQKQFIPQIKKEGLKSNTSLTSSGIVALRHSSEPENINITNSQPAILKVTVPKNELYYDPDPYYNATSITNWLPIHKGYKKMQQKKIYELQSNNVIPPQNIKILDINSFEQEVLRKEEEIEDREWDEDFRKRKKEKERYNLLKNLNSDNQSNDKDAPLGILRGKLKLGTEDDDLQPVNDEDSEDMGMRVPFKQTLYNKYRKKWVPFGDILEEEEKEEEQNKAFRKLFEDNKSENKMIWTKWKEKRDNIKLQKEMEDKYKEIQKRKILSMTQNEYFEKIFDLEDPYITDNEDDEEEMIPLPPDFFEKRKLTELDKKLIKKYSSKKEIEKANKEMKEKQDIKRKNWNELADKYGLERSESIQQARLRNAEKPKHWDEIAKQWGLEEDE